MSQITGIALRHKDEELCHFWFITATLTRPRLVRHKWQLDGGPGKDGKHKKYHSAFRLELGEQEARAQLDPGDNAGRLNETIFQSMKP